MRYEILYDGTVEEPWFRVGGTDDIHEAHRWLLQCHQVGHIAFKAKNVILLDTDKQEYMPARIFGRNQALRNRWLTWPMENDREIKAESQKLAAV